MFRKKKPAAFITAALLCLASVCAGCAADKAASDYADNPVAGRETVAQVSTIDAILGGVYDGVMDYETLQGYGDFGIGTFTGLDGEMVAFDGDYYQVKADGIAYPVSGTQQTPFAAVTWFDADSEWDVPAGVDYAGFQEFLDGVLPTENAFYAVRVDGVFSYMKTRSVPAQTKPYPPLVEVTAHQPEFEFRNVAGTLAGFRCPPYAAGVNVVGYHMHFLTESRDAGGHVLDFTIENATVKVDRTGDFLMILPDGGSDFYKIDLTPDNQEELEKAEK
jgi:acetolactate decarboxylase